MKTARVTLGSRSYGISVGAGLIRSLLDHLPAMPEVEKTGLITDSNVEPLYGDLVMKQLHNLGPVHRVVVQAGESSKSWKVAGEILETLAANQLRRHDLVVTLGGGMISDLGGYAASAYLRGVRVVHLPTTLLGQVDAAIGGKTGVNLSAGKNLAGAFYQPSAVVCDVETLLSLPGREFRSGLAEVIKYGLCFDQGILRHFGGPRDSPARPAPGFSGTAVAAAYEGLSEPAALPDLVYACASIKARIVSGDETDRSQRLLLNYGHTFGHALEAAGGFTTWSHGEAISVGMVFAANLAVQAGMLDERLEAVHRRALEGAGLPIRASFDPAEVSRLWEMDKKRDTRQRWVLLEDLGKPVIRSDIEPAHIDAAMAAVRC